jgi:hypothetical protein
MSFVRNLLNEQRRRAVGSLMQYLEGNVYKHLTDQERKELRSRVIASIGAYHDVCLDMLKASVNDGTVMNDEAARLLASLNGKVDRLIRDDHG